MFALTDLGLSRRGVENGETKYKEKCEGRWIQKRATHSILPSHVCSFPLFTQLVGDTREEIEQNCFASGAAVEFHVVSRGVSHIKPAGVCVSVSVCVCVPNLRREFAAAKK